MAGGLAEGGSAGYVAGLAEYRRDPWNHDHGIGSRLLQGFSDLL